jgi:hypothetical protein
MLTMSNITASSERPLKLATAPVVLMYGHRLGPWALKLVVTCTIAILSGVNVWWYWRDNVALPNLKTVSEWIRREQYTRAEPVLHEHLRKSSHDGEARMMLARVLAGRGDLLGCARQLHAVPFWWPLELMRREPLLGGGSRFHKRIGALGESDKIASNSGDQER